MHDAIKTCFAQEARVCTHGDMQELCGSGMNPFEGHSAGWFGDHGSVHGGDWDDEYGTWNRNWCDKNNDGPTAHANNVKPFRCCRSGALSAGRTAVCPNQLTAMSTQNGEICASGFQSQTNIHTAFDRCRGMKGHVCLHNDMQQLCGGGNPFQGSSRGWFGDHGTASGGNWDDEFGTWDNEVCNGDNDGKAYHSHHSYKYRCCAASTAVQEHGTTVTKECDAGFTRYGGLCWMNPNVRKNAHDAIEHCRGLKAHMCEHVEMQTVCAHGKNPYGDSQGWYGDHGKRGSSWDDHYGSWNHGNCAGNNDGPAYSSGHSFTFRCCKRAFVPLPQVQPNPQPQVAQAPGMAWNGVCYNSRGGRPLDHVGHVRTVADCISKAQGYKYFGLGCPSSGGFECWRGNSIGVHSKKIDMQECMGTPLTNIGNGAQNGHCSGFPTGTFTQDHQGLTIPLGGWHREPVYETSLASR